MDLHQTNKFQLQGHGGYGLTGALENFRAKQKAEQQLLRDLGPEPEDTDNLLDSDLMNTNPVLVKDGAPVFNHRYEKEQKSVININSAQREIYDYSIRLARNEETGLYTREVIDDEGERQIQLYTVDILNNEFVPGASDVPRPYYLHSNGDIGKLEYKDGNPNSYTIVLPRTFVNVKSVRLLSVEIPNTLSAITPSNNTITLDIYDNDTESSVELTEGKSPFSYIMFQLDPGNYTLTELISHLQTRVNEIVEDYTVDAFEDLFTITLNQNTGKVSILLTDPVGRDLTFHWKFWDTSATTNLWRLLGFATSYQLNTDGTDKYVKELTNLFDFGLNPALVGTVTDREEFHVFRPFQTPDLLPHTYIYLDIQGMGSLDDIHNPHLTNFKDQSLFAKIIMNVPPGDTTYTFVHNPMIYPDTLPRLNKLVIRWLDAEGNLIDFMGLNHSFTLEIIEYTDHLDNVNYNSRRGIIDQTSYPELIKGGGGTT